MAVDLASDTLWSTLSATLVVQRKALRDPSISQAVDSAIARLRYGTVTINGFNGLSFVFASAPWSAYLRVTLEDIKSGRRAVHYTSKPEGIEKVGDAAPSDGGPQARLLRHTSYRAQCRPAHRGDGGAGWAKVPGTVDKHHARRSDTPFNVGAGSGPRGRKYRPIL